MSVDYPTFPLPQYLRLAQNSYDPLNGLSQERQRVHADSAALAQVQDDQMSEWLKKVLLQLHQSSMTQARTPTAPNMLSPWQKLIGGQEPQGNLIGAANNWPNGFDSALDY